MTTHLTWPAPVPLLRGKHGYIFNSSYQKPFLSSFLYAHTVISLCIHVHENSFFPCHLLFLLHHKVSGQSSRRYNNGVKQNRAKLEVFRFSVGNFSPYNRLHHLSTAHSCLYQHLNYMISQFTYKSLEIWIQRVKYQYVLRTQDYLN